MILQTTDPDLLELQRLFNVRLEDQDCDTCHKVNCICDDEYRNLKELECEG